MLNTKNITTGLPQLRGPSPKESHTQEARNPFIDHQSIVIVKEINKAKFPVYLAACHTDRKNYALKVFPHAKEAPSTFFQNEARFASLKHPNVIDTINYQGAVEILHQNEIKNGSYILIEYAPHGDFFHLIMKHQSQMDEKLIRTYFRQLIEGMEYLHQNRVAHLDLKPDNLLIGADFSLKIADFDLSYMHGDTKVLGRGTTCCRAPELYISSTVQARLESLLAADIYNAGVILFILKSGGIYPHCENRRVRGIDLQNLMYNDNREFWKVHCGMKGKSDSFYDKDFRELFNSLVKLNPFERSSIENIKNFKWYKGSVYNPEDLQSKMKKILCP